MNYDLEKLATPCYLLDLGLLKRNLSLLKDIQAGTNCRILLAQKGFAAWSTYGLCSQYLAGAACSSLHEARLAREFFGGEVHLCAPAYRDDDMPAYLDIVDHIVFNSFTQWARYKDAVLSASRPIQAGIRVNPMHSEVTTKLYDPCAPGSRLGVIRKFFEAGRLDGISGLHFHTLCELNADSLDRTLKAVREQFDSAIRRMDWVNFGGGHHITRPDYDVNLLCDLIVDFYKAYPNIKTIYLEPGEAVALNTGVLVASVLDIMHNAMDIAILDTSASAHMPDVLEMPYRPIIFGASTPGDKPHTYRLAGPTCLAGDVIGDYSFDRPLEIGQKLVFADMAHYTMVKNTMFNGINLPDIVLYDPDSNTYKLQRRFTYEDFKSRLS
ncbi:MAG: carboxynorspermidine decarboxylase [Planctomycetaceae bacterium]|nr:carboxynorspermidine decarboxylase [Planctomycetaceae bacterium]